MSPFEAFEWAMNNKVIIKVDDDPYGKRIRAQHGDWRFQLILTKRDLKDADFWDLKLTMALTDLRRTIENGPERKLEGTTGPSGRDPSRYSS